MNTNSNAPGLATLSPPTQRRAACSAGWMTALALSAALMTSRADQQSSDLHGFGGWKADGLGFVVGTGDRTLLAADVNGDDLDDIIEFATDPGQGDSDSDVYVAINGPEAFTWKTKWHDWFCIGREYPLAGDFDGDGRDDIACLIRSESSGTAEGDVYVALSTGTTFGTSSKWHEIFCIGSEIPFAGDFNGDGKDDLVSFTADTNADVYVTTSNGSAFVGSGGAARWHGNFCPTGSLPRVGDFNGDGRDDIAYFVRNSQTGTAVGDVYVALSTGTGFGTASKWHDYFCIGTELPFIGDFNGDGTDDILTKLANGTKYVAFSHGTSFKNTGAIWHRAHADGITVTGRFNGDLNTDLMAIRETNFGFRILNASIALAGGFSPPDPVLPSVFGYGSRVDGGPVQSPRPLIVVILEGTNADGRLPITHSQSDYDSLVFGPGDPSINNFYEEMSGGQFTWQKAGIIGPVTDPSPTTDHKVQAVLLAADNFDFSTFDTNNNNIVDPSELSILVVDNYTSGSGQTSPITGSVDLPGGGGQTIAIDIKVAAVGHRAVFDIYAHELAHCIDTLDLYGFSGKCAFNVSLMGAVVNSKASHFDWPRVDYLDIWHRMALGWIQPVIYDIRDGPGAAVINAAQLSFEDNAKRPIILYDSAQGTDEFYMLEYRTGAFDDGVRICEESDPAAHFTPEWLKGYSGTNFASAGYDLWFNHEYRGGGMAIWYVQQEADKSLSHDKRRILPGGNDKLDSEIEDGSDDVYTWIKNNTVKVIDPGPNNVIDTEQVGDDGKQGDYLCLLTLTPGPNDRLSRGSAHRNVYNHSDGPLDVEWFDETPVDLDIRIGTQDNRQASVSWGARNQPFIEAFSKRIMWPGSAPARLEMRTGGHVEPSVVLYNTTNTATYPVTTSSWDFGGCTVSIPPNIPQGHYLLQSQVTEGGTVRVSNSFPVTVSDPYDLWAFLSLPGTFKRQPTDDPDGDGWNNFAEYAMSSNPALTTDPGSGVSNGFRTLQPSGELQFYMQWPMATNLPIVDYRINYSWDLQHWFPVTILQSIPNGDPGFNWLRGYCNPDPVHHRAFLKLQFIKTNEP